MTHDGAEFEVRGALAEGIASAKMLMGRYLAGFDDASATATAPGLPNHVVWSLGHCALTMNRVAEKLDGLPLPAEHFGAGGFIAEQVSFGSNPAGGGAYPSLARAIEIYNSACDRLADACRHATLAQLTAATPWGGGSTTIALLVMRMLFHNGFHTGQIADLRRVRGMKSVF